MKVQEIVCMKLGMSQLEYCNFQLESGWQYLSDQCGSDSEAKSYLETLPMFWSWWRNEWNLRDEYFLTTQLDKDWELPIKSIYMIYHTSVIEGHERAGAILDEGFSQLRMYEFKKMKQSAK